MKQIKYTNVRNLAGKSTGIIKMSDLRGKSVLSWVKVGNTYGIGVAASGNPISESIDKARNECTRNIFNQYKVSIKPEFILGATTYSTDKLAKTITTKIITDINSSSARIEVDVYKFQ